MAARSTDILVECDGRAARRASVETLACARARLHLSPQRTARGRGRRRARCSEGMPGDPAAIQAEMDRIAAEREASQPLRSRTGGSTFKNPPGHQGLAADRRGRLPRPARSATRRSRRSIATSCSTSAAPSSAEIEALGEEVRRRVKATVGRRRSNGKSSGWGWRRERKLHVAVLMGGWSAEREVSLITGDGVADALESRGHRVTRIDMDRDVAAAARRGRARRRVQRAPRHARRGRHGAGHDGPDGPADTPIAASRPR